MSNIFVSLCIFGFIFFLLMFLVASFIHKEIMMNWFFSLFRTTPYNVNDILYSFNRTLKQLSDLAKNLEEEASDLEEEKQIIDKTIQYNLSEAQRARHVFKKLDELLK